MIALSTDHCTALVYQLASGTSPYPATAPAGGGDPISNTAVNATTNPTDNQTRVNASTRLDLRHDIDMRQQSIC